MVETGTMVRTMVHRGGRGTMETRSMSGAAAGAIFTPAPESCDSSGEKTGVAA